ncbi:probable inactive protein kinase DDB_G0270444 [Ricinus communis]|uniref:probable inactive protein kinase DDB_G0270444 n=1 Tax=Ricinus communis TaxID=3988 RepID=UPI00201B1B99|nr:probable inactive protein kinase DDB_G0270444 [Ricinus communis]XP_015575437.2 probable inactive protein kinase DDB_G0270444 [Ricinus communis]
MEVTSNGEITETQNVKQEKEEYNKVITEDIEVESVREIVVDGKSEGLKEAQDDGNNLNSDSSKSLQEEAKEESSLVKDSGILEEPEVEEDNSTVKDPGMIEEEAEVEKEAINSIIEAVEHIVPSSEQFSSIVEASIENSKEFDSTEVELKETDESETNEIATIVADVELSGTKETMLPSSTSNGTEGNAFELVSGGVEEIELPASEDKYSLPGIAKDSVSKAIEEKVMSLDENNEVPPALTDAISKGIEEVKVASLEEKSGEFSTIVDKEPVEIVDNSLKPSANPTVIASKDGFPESTGNPHVISVSQRTIQPTSWRSCCGLFEVLRGSR